MKPRNPMLEKRKEDRRKKEELLKLGLTKNNFKYCTDIKELKKIPPGVVLAKVKKDGAIKFENTAISIKSGQVYVMSHGIYNNLSSKSDHLVPNKKRFGMYFKRYNGQKLDNKKLLIWRNGGIGDLLFSQPIVKYLKEKYPTCEISYATLYMNVPFLLSWPSGLIDRVLYVPFPLKEMTMADYHLSFEGVIERCHMARKENAYDMFKNMAGLDFDIRDYNIELNPNEDIIKEVGGQIPDNLILIQMRSSSRIRNMAYSKWVNIVKILKEYNYNIGFIDSPEKSEIYNTLIKEGNLDSKKVHNLCPISKDIQYGVAIMSKAKGLLGVDSSFIHIAAALKKPVFGIYAPFKADLRMRYYDNTDWIDPEKYENGCGRYPCFFHSNDTIKCPFVEKNLPPGCFNQIDEEEVVTRFIRLLESN